MKINKITKVVLALNIAVTGVAIQQSTYNDGEAYVRSGKATVATSETLKSYYSQNPVYLYDHEIEETGRTGIYETVYTFGQRYGYQSAYIKTVKQYKDGEKVNFFILRDTYDRAAFDTSIGGVSKAHNGYYQSTTVTTEIEKDNKKTI